jgi:hypothetical protein
MDIYRRVTASCAVSGGAVWAAACLYRSTLPRGCIGEECLTRSMRGDTPLGTALFAVAAGLLVAAGSGLLMLMRRQGRLGRLAVAGVLATAAGVALLAAGLVITAAVGDDFQAMPAFVIPGLGLVVVGVVLTGAAVIRSRMMSWWAGCGLIIGAGLMLFANEQTAAVLCAAPFGIAWIAIGTELWQPSRQRRSSGTSAPRPGSAPSPPATVDQRTGGLGDRARD